MNAFKQFSEDFRDYMEEKKLTTKRLSTTKKFIPIGPYNLEKANQIFTSKHTNQYEKNTYSINSNAFNY